MIYLQRGDRLPSVGLIQKLLNICRTLDPALDTLRELETDGVYGAKTQAAVKAAKTTLGLTPADSTFDRHLWRPLANMAKWRIVDVCDLAFESYLTSKPHTALRDDLIEKHLRVQPTAKLDELQRIYQGKLRKWNQDAIICRQQFNRFTAMGGQPIPLFRSKSAYDEIRKGIHARSVGGWQVVMLRMTGHGAPGEQGVAGSLLGALEINRDRVTLDDMSTDLDFLDGIMIGGMTMPMAKFGVVELHGCRVGLRGRPRRGQPKVDGPAFLQAFAASVGRPTSAGRETQLIGNAKLDTRFEGPPVTALPGGGTIAQWFANTN